MEVELYIMAGSMTLQTVWAVLFGGLWRSRFFDRERKAEWLLPVVSEGNRMDRQESGVMGVDVKWGKGGGGAGSDWLADGGDRHGSF
jgi:hypothetical protein